LLSFPKNGIISKKKNVAITPEQQPKNLDLTSAEQAGNVVVKENKEQEPKKEKAENFKPEIEKKPLAEKLRLLKKPKNIPLPRKIAKDPTMLKVEKIMEEGLREAYDKMPPIAQQEFKIKGEEVAEKINQLLKKTHVQVKKIFALIFEWLKIIPGVNYFFLEQEAKIKTDKILALKNRPRD